jgi:hypothetical protein
MPFPCPDDRKHGCVCLIMHLNPTNYKHNRSTNFIGAVFALLFFPRFPTTIFFIITLLQFHHTPQNINNLKTVSVLSRLRVQECSNQKSSGSFLHFFLSSSSTCFLFFYPKQQQLLLVVTV